MNNKLTELVFILDKSGSMHGLEGDTIGGFNSLIEKQKKEEGEVYVSTVLFDTGTEVLYDRLPIEKIPEMTEKDYRAGGCTALLDALGGAIRHIANIHRYARPEDVPAHTLFAVMTDGLENASRRFDSRTVKQMIKERQEEYGWEFLFLGANIDAVETARNFGIREDRAVKYCSDKAGTRLNYRVVGEAVCSLRAGKALEPNWSAEIEAYREEQEGKTGKR